MKGSHQCVLFIYWNFIIVENVEKSKIISWDKYELFKKSGENSGFCVIGEKSFRNTDFNCCCCSIVFLTQIYRYWLPCHFDDSIRNVLI